MSLLARSGAVAASRRSAGHLLSRAAAPGGLGLQQPHQSVPSQSSLLATRSPAQQQRRRFAWQSHSQANRQQQQHKQQQQNTQAGVDHIPEELWSAPGSKFEPRDERKFLNLEVTQADPEAERQQQEAKEKEKWTKAAFVWSAIKYGSPLVLAYWLWRRERRKQALEAARTQVSAFPKEIRMISRRARLSTSKAVQLNESLERLWPQGWANPEEFGGLLQLVLRKQDQDKREERAAELRQLIQQRQNEQIRRSIERARELKANGVTDGSGGELDVEVEVDMQQELWEEELEDLAQQSQPIIRNPRKFASLFMFWEMLAFCRALGSHEARSDRLAQPAQVFPRSGALGGSSASAQQQRRGAVPTAATFGAAQSVRETVHGLEIMPAGPLAARWRAPGEVPLDYLRTALALIIEDKRAVPLSPKELELEFDRRRKQEPVNYDPSLGRRFTDWVGITQPPELPDFVKEVVLAATKQVQAPEAKLRFAWYVADPSHTGLVAKGRLRELVRDMVNTGHFDVRSLIKQVRAVPPEFHVLDSEDLTREILLHVREQRRQKLRRQQISGGGVDSSSEEGAAAQLEIDGTAKNPNRRYPDIADLQVNEVSYREFKLALQGFTYGQRAKVWYMPRSGDLGFWAHFIRHRRERVRNFLIRNGYSEEWLDKMPDIQKLTQ